MSINYENRKLNMKTNDLQYLIKAYQDAQYEYTHQVETSKKATQDHTSIDFETFA